MKIDAQYILNEAKIVEGKVAQIPENLKIEVEAKDIMAISTAYSKDTLLGKDNFKTLILKSYKDIDIDEHYIIDNDFRDKNNLPPISIEEECSFQIKYTRVNYFLQVEIHEGKYGYIANYPTLKTHEKREKIMTPAYQLVKLIKHTIKELKLESYIVDIDRSISSFKYGKIIIRGVSSMAGNVSIMVNTSFLKFKISGRAHGINEKRASAFVDQIHKLTKTMRRHSDKTRLRLYKTICPKAFGALFEQDYLDDLNPSLRYNIILAINDCIVLLSKAIPNTSAEELVEVLPKLLEKIANHKEIADKDKTKTLFKILMLAWFNFKDLQLKECYVKGETLDKDVYNTNSAIISIKDVFSLTIVEHPIVKSLVTLDGIKESILGLRLLESIVAVELHNDIELIDNNKYNIALGYEKKSEIATIVLKEAIDLFSALNPGEANG